MLDTNDSQLLLQIEASLLVYTHKNYISYDHKKNIKHTESLYRFGIFVLDGYEYSISACKFKDKIITFENEISHNKIKFSVNDSIVISGEFTKDTLVEKKVKYIRNKLSYWLKDLSDKLRT